MANFELFIYAFIFVQVLLVAIHDIKYKKISNQWAVINLILFGAFIFIFPDKYSFNLQTFFYSLVFFVVGFFGFMMRIIGAGDSKYLFSLFLLTPQVWHDQTFNLLLASTMVIGGFSLFTQFIQNYEKIVTYTKSGYIAGVRECLGNKFPYAPVILMSWIWLGFYIF